MKVAGIDVHKKVLMVVVEADRTARGYGEGVGTKIQPKAISRLHSGAGPVAPRPDAKSDDGGVYSSTTAKRASMKTRPSHRGPQEIARQRLQWTA